MEIFTFWRKTRLKFNRPMYLGAKRKTKLLISQGIVGILHSVKTEGFSELYSNRKYNKKKWGQTPPV